MSEDSLSISYSKLVPSSLRFQLNVLKLIGISMEFLYSKFSNSEQTRTGLGPNDRSATQIPDQLVQV